MRLFLSLLIDNLNTTLIIYFDSLLLQSKMHGSLNDKPSLSMLFIESNLAMRTMFCFSDFIRMRQISASYTKFLKVFRQTTICLNRIESSINYN